MNPIEILSSAADSPSEFDIEGNIFELSRSGVKYSGELIVHRGTGTLVKEADGSLSELDIYVQKKLFRLDYLAIQVGKKLEEISKTRAVDFIDSPARLSSPTGPSREVAAVAEAIRSELLTSEYGSTKIVTLMAPAGQGKTVLIEHVALDSVLAYQPMANPTPIVLPVDLLGRNVGNIDDAIAGSLNNTYSGPQLRQRDVLFCLRNNWLALALDGFDELVARVGVADAFTHVSNLIDELQGSGTILLSGRKSFFDTFEIEQAIGRFLRPTAGTYSTVSVELLRWREEQAIKVFEKLNFSNAKETLQTLNKQFRDDESIVFHPFFLTRLAVIMQDGGSVDLQDGTDRLGRAKWVIETFLQRELGKWTNKIGSPLLTMDEHTTMLGGVAEEMWITGAFMLKQDELRLSALIGLNHLRLSTATWEEVSSRITTHAAFASTNGSFSFFHEQVRHFALGHRIAYYLKICATAELSRLFSQRTLPPDTIDWASWFFHKEGSVLTTTIDFLNNTVAAMSGATILNENLALVTAALIDHQNGPMRLSNQRFYGDALLGRYYREIEFDRCSFWQANLDGTQFESCIFSGCEFGFIRCDASTSLKESSFDENCTFEGIQSTLWSAYSEQEIISRLRALGAIVNRKSIEQTINNSPQYDDGLVKAVERLVRASLKTFDIAAEDFEEWCPDYAKDVLRAGVNTGILKSVWKQTGGPKKNFYRIQGDKQELLSARANPEADTALGHFWKTFVK